MLDIFCGTPYVSFVRRRRPPTIVCRNYVCLETQQERTDERRRIISNSVSYVNEYGPRYAASVVPSLAQAAFIYVLCDPRPGYNNGVYIGRTENNVFARMYEHLAEALSITIRGGTLHYRSHSPVNKWLRKLHELKLQPVVCTLEVVSQRLAGYVERLWIQVLARRFADDCLNTLNRRLGTKSTCLGAGKKQRGDKPALPPLPPPPPPVKQQKIILTAIHPAFYEEVEEPIVYCPNALEKGST